MNSRLATIFSAFAVLSWPLRAAAESGFISPRDNGSAYGLDPQLPIELSMLIWLPLVVLTLLCSLLLLWNIGADRGPPPEAQAQRDLVPTYYLDRHDRGAKHAA